MITVYAVNLYAADGTLWQTLLVDDERPRAEAAARRMAESWTEQIEAGMSIRVDEVRQRRYEELVPSHGRRRYGQYWE